MVGGEGQRAQGPVLKKDTIFVIGCLAAAVVLECVGRPSGVTDSMAEARRVVPAGKIAAWV